MRKNKLQNLFKVWRLNITAATAVEYTVLASAIAGAVVVTFFLFGDEVGALFDQILGLLFG